jgi:hypothetical protein
MTIRRGCQGGKRYRVFAMQNECYFDHSADEIQAIVWFYETKQNEVLNAGKNGKHDPMSEMQLDDVL